VLIDDASSDIDILRGFERNNIQYSFGKSTGTMKPFEIKIYAL
jgi:hypothetical protein